MAEGSARVRVVRPGPGGVQGGIQAELQALAGPKVQVATIASTGTGPPGGRPVIAVRVGVQPTHASAAPTVYVIGTHHAREWVAEEVPLRMLRDYVAAVNNPASNPTLAAALTKAAVVFVPMLNPDGYQHSRDPNPSTGYRDQRKNMRPGCMEVQGLQMIGVDINRNYDAAWGKPSDSTGLFDCAENYVGPSAASEPETRGVQKLLQGGVFQGTASAALITYHSYEDTLTYPEVYRPFTNAAGPACDLFANCTSPDLTLYRRLFGETRSPILFDPEPGMTSSPLAIGPSMNVSYTTSGDLTKFAAAQGIPAVTVEMTNGIGFAIECDPNRDAVLTKLVSDNEALLLRVLNAAPGLVAPSLASTYAENQLSRVALGLYARENDHNGDARPSLVAGVSHFVKNFSQKISFSGTTVAMKPARPGIHYDAWYADMPALTSKKPWCLPCEIHVGGDLGTYKFNCTTCVDLTDPGRLPHAGWNLVKGMRGGATDYWWEPDASPAKERTLTVPGMTVPAKALDCHLNFSFEWSGGAAGAPAVRLERWTAAGWTEMTRWPFDGSAVRKSRRQLTLTRTEFFETSIPVPVAASITDSFRFRVAAGDSVAGFLLFEPIQVCHIGVKP